MKFDEHYYKTLQIKFIIVKVYHRIIIAEKKEMVDNRA